MITTLYIYESSCTDPYINLAIEQYLLQNVDNESCILYLWQNQNTVVIGRNQNPWVECRTELLNEEGGKLARRLSGGGAVFHDLGNLNFTFLMCEENFDLTKQLQVIQHACAGVGIETAFSGRNDLLADGKKFSGNAFYHAGGKAYHHGTLLIDADMNKLQRYLSPSKAKLQAKGVASVRSRVINLKELSPDLSCESMKVHMRKAFSDIYALPCQPYVLSDDAESEIQSATETNGSQQWLFGVQLPFTFSCDDRFDWGSIQLNLQINKGKILDVAVYTDSMQWNLSSILADCLRGCPFHMVEIEKALLGCSNLDKSIATDIYKLLRSQSI